MLAAMLTDVSYTLSLFCTSVRLVIEPPPFRNCLAQGFVVHYPSIQLLFLSIVFDVKMCGAKELQR